MDKKTVMSYNWVTWARSSAGRALRWHRRGQGFDPPRVHFFVGISDLKSGLSDCWLDVLFQVNLRGYNLRQGSWSDKIKLRACSSVG